MGLDSVELVMEWEDAFGIAIPDAAAETLQTPRCATDHVFSQLEQRRATECIWQQICFRLRRGFRRAIGEPSVRWRHNDGSRDLPRVVVPAARRCCALTRRRRPASEGSRRREPNYLR